MERERYGRGGGGGGINRYPDVSGRTQQAPPPREDRGRGRSDRPAQAPAARGSNEPWSDVPPELEALLRAQVAQKPAPGRPGQAPAPTSEPVIDRDAEAVEADATVGSGAAAPKARATRKPAAAKATTAKSAAKPRATRKPAAATADATGPDDPATGDAPARPATKPRATRKPAAKADATAADGSAGDAAPAAAPKRRTTRKVAAPAEPV